jgi:cytochrome c-type biogenesis protein CcmH
MRRPGWLALAATLAVAAFAAAAGIAAAPPPAAAHARASLTDIENDVMCVACRESLAVAQSPQAQSEREYIRALIARGLDKAQIEKELVAQYGPAVLGRPPARGVNLTVYVLPPAILAAGLAALAVALPRWRRRARSAAPTSGASSLTAVDARRLEEELSRFDG